MADLLTFLGLCLVLVTLATLFFYICFFDDKKIRITQKEKLLEMYEAKRDVYERRYEHAKDPFTRKDLDRKLMYVNAHIDELKTEIRQLRRKRF